MFVLTSQRCKNTRKLTGLQVSLSSSSEKVVKISEIEQIDLKSGDYILPVDRPSTRGLDRVKKWLLAEI